MLYRDEKIDLLIVITWNMLYRYEKADLLIVKHGICYTEKKR